MGKNRTIKSLGNIIGNVVAHKIVVRHTNKPESVKRMSHEIEAYGNDAAQLSLKFNWNDKDKLEISEETLKKFKKVMIEKYPDVKFSMSEAEEEIDNTIDDLIGKI